MIQVDTLEAVLGYQPTPAIDRAPYAQGTIAQQSSSPSDPPVWYNDIELTAPPARPAGSGTNLLSPLRAAGFVGNPSGPSRIHRRSSRRRSPRGEAPARSTRSRVALSVAPARKPETRACASRRGAGSGNA
jgi:hypothetical protein